jgi:hypothetical protein
MSDHLAHARTFVVETTDVRTRARGGKEITLRTTRSSPCGGRTVSPSM